VVSLDFCTQFNSPVDLTAFGSSEDIAAHTNLFPTGKTQAEICSSTDFWLVTSVS
jgi:hypothetical protein